MRHPDRSWSRALPAFLALGFLLSSFVFWPACTSEPEGLWEVHSLEEAKAMAAERDAVILVDFWKRH